MSIVNLKITFVKKQRQTRKRPTQGRGTFIYNSINGRFHTRDGLFKVRWVNFEWTIRLTLSISFDGQFEDGLSVSDSLWTSAPTPQKKIGEAVSVGEGATVHRRIIHFYI